MTRFKIIGAAALLASALATPAFAQQVVTGPARCTDASCQTMAPGYRDTSYQRRVYRQDPNWQDSYNRYDPAWPVDAAAGVVGAAVGTAAAVATAPFGGPDYYAQGYAPYGSESYARLNGFVCTPGTWFRGSDGLQHPCQ